MDFAVTKGTYRYVMFDAHPMGLILRNHTKQRKDHVART